MSRRTRHPSFYKRLRELGHESYDAYLRSGHWRRTKARYRSDEDLEQCCYCCGDWEDTHLHHKTYERVGAELLEDLVPLCARCHSMVHVLERRGDIGIDLVGLLDAARAKRYERERLPVVPPAEARTRDDAARRQRSHNERMTRRRTKEKGRK